MGKLKTKKTLLKRIRITKNGKIVRKQIGIGHLKVKWSSKRKFRKAKKLVQKNKGHIKKLKRLLGNHV
ncbi:hypothetical protein A2V49_02960 [candidate division WWE3 bacterium RBG_19FT_COMBO_34_6]|uniref:Large ribosomal subunit protein bL35 n=1 Tax=candidate division WWE3 bacterium RBG_19FT_COMBO_34_6 TaxID=1802612 RepID=A0A1F4UL14_UNCKA|nr:MAG: hypothetical protein A2V49_02960 [candidate division WWE3 bacterium RBG_19FT_COMBO_34_6]